MCNNDANAFENGLHDVLKVILLLQQSVCKNDRCLETCDRGFLGQNSTTFNNTRPIVLYMAGSGNTPLAMPISRDPAVTDTSTVFRLEKLDENCATFRVLAPATDPASTSPYIATNSFFTLNLNCLCILRCLEDTYVDTP